jgi:uncharacterized Zn finger protein
MPMPGHDPDLSADRLRRAAGDVIFERGEDYVRYVRGLQGEGGWARASVQAKRVYDVELVWTGGEIGGECTCPRWAGGNFCKHLVAVGLAVLGADPPAEDVLDTGIAACLDQLDRPGLRELIGDIVGRDSAALRLVQARAVAAGSASAVDSATLTSRVSEILRVGFVDYRRSFEVAQAAQALLSELQEMLDAGAAAGVLPALERAAARLRKITLNADDSGGVIGDACQRAVDLHARAACAGHPQPVRLARWLAKFRIDSPGWPVTTLPMYVDAFDDKALSVYRAAVQKESETLRGADHWHRFEVDQMLLELADHDGDVDEAIRLLSAGEHPTFAAIITRLGAAGRPDEAMRWLDRAVTEGRVGRTGQQRNEYWVQPQDAADSYLAVGRGADAIAVVRASFRQQPSPASLRLLLRIAAALDSAQTEQAWAIATAEEQAARPHGNGSALVEIALAEDDLVAAWSAAERFGAGQSWRQLAERSAADLPVAAADLYRPEIERLLQNANTKVYPAIGKLLARMRDLYARADEQATFATYASDIRSRFGRRPSLLKELDRRGIS